MLRAYTDLDDVCLPSNPTWNKMGGLTAAGTARKRSLSILSLADEHHAAMQLEVTVLPNISRTIECRWEDEQEFDGGLT